MAVGWAQVDGQRTLGDGGDWLLLHEARLGAPWSGAFTASLNHGRDLVRIDGGPLQGPRLQRVTTREVDLSLVVGEWVRLGLAVPLHGSLQVQNRLERQRFGDTFLFASIPITQGPPGGLQGTWTVGVDLPTGPEELWLGDPGAVDTRLALSGPMGPFRWAANLGPRFMAGIPLPGTVWGNSLTWGLGLRAEPMGPLFLAAELAGRAPPKFYAGGPADHPTEGLGVVGLTLSDQVALSAGGGRGLTSGLGAPALRWIAAVDVRPRELADRDEDGLADLRDVCPRQPEDRDGHRDGDGCPDPDNDGDGLLDRWDDCPLLAENLNGVDDHDGCPEQATDLAVRLATEGDVQTVHLVIGDDHLQLLPGETVRRLVREAEVVVTASAERHHPRTETLSLYGREQLGVDWVLEAIPYGRLVVVAEHEGAAVEATVSVDEEPFAGGELAAGEHDVHIVADGYRPAQRRVVVPADDELRLVVSLLPSGVRREGDRLDVGSQVLFARDEAVLVDTGPLAELVDWLGDHPEAQLVRVEGHADATGTSAYNYDLSVRRAEAVQTWLVAEGVAPERLQAIGTGEARGRGGDEAADRRVGFVVLVWTE